MFLVDSSGSIQQHGVNSYGLMQQFIQKIVEHLNIGLDRARVALAIFSTYAQLQWDYQAYSTQEELKQAIDNLPYFGGV